MPSSVIPDFNVTSGKPVRMKRANASLMPASFGFKQAGFNGDSGCPQLFESFSGNFGIWICHGRDHTLYTRSNQRVSAWRRASLMAMRFKIEIDGAAACTRPSLLQGQNFSVLDAVKCVEAFANELPIAIGNDRSHAGAGRSERCATARKLQGLAHEVFVLCRKCHGLQEWRIAINYVAEQ